MTEQDELTGASISMESSQVSNVMLYMVTFACGFQRRSRSGDVPLYATSSTNGPGTGKLAVPLSWRPSMEKMYTQFHGVLIIYARNMFKDNIGVSRSPSMHAWEIVSLN